MPTHPAGSSGAFSYDQIVYLPPKPLKNFRAAVLGMIVDHDDLRPTLLWRQRTEDTLEIDLLIAGRDDDGDFSGPQFHPREPSRHEPTTDKNGPPTSESSNSGRILIIMEAL